MNLWRPIANRPRLIAGIVVGVAVALALQPLGLRPSTRAILAWDAGCAAFIGLVLHFMAGRTGSEIRARAAQEDEGRGVILGLVVLAAAASLGAIGAELSLARDATGAERGLRVALAFATVAGSWFAVQLIFALHYAHEYYTAAADRMGDVGGLRFPGEEDPDYWDFLHFAAVIGVAAQTADIAFTSRRLRRIGTVHSLVAFVFNTVVLALTINLLAGLFA